MIDTMNPHPLAALGNLPLPATSPEANPHWYRDLPYEFRAKARAAATALKAAYEYRTLAAQESIDMILAVAHALTATEDGQQPRARAGAVLSALFEHAAQHERQLTADTAALAAVSADLYWLSAVTDVPEEVHTAYGRADCRSCGTPARGDRERFYIHRGGTSAPQPNTYGPLANWVGVCLKCWRIVKNNNEVARARGYRIHRDEDPRRSPIAHDSGGTLTEDKWDWWMLNDRGELTEYGGRGGGYVSGRWQYR